MNKVILMGRLTADPTVTVNGEVSVARFTLAVDRRGKRKEDKQNADFINCVAFRHTTDFIRKYFKKGSGMVVSGRIQTGSYKNKEGINIHTTDIVVEEVEFSLGNSKSSDNTAVSAASTTSAPTLSEPATDPDGFTAVSDDDVPEWLK